MTAAPETERGQGSKLEEAELLATLAHGNQRYGDHPYIWHLGAVERVLRRFGVEDDEMLQAAWLHDVFEDTVLTPQDLEPGFTRRVIALVEAVTNVPGDPRATAARHLGTPGGLQLKLADRIANVEASGTGPHFASYRQGYKAWKARLYGYDPTLAPMWKHLDNLLA